MHLSRIELSKNGQKAVLQGMVHVGPAKLYKILQKDVDWAEKNGYLVFFEGVKRVPLNRQVTRNEKKIRVFFRYITRLYPVLANKFGITTQKDNITYPKNSINADISFAEFTKKLDENGFTCNMFLFFITRAVKKFGLEDIKKSVNKEFKDIKDLEAKSITKKIIAYLLFRKAMPVMLTLRDKTAVSYINRYSGNRNIFVHYGEKHIKGIKKLLQKNGWKIDRVHSFEAFNIT